MIVGGGFFVISFFMVSFLCCRCGHNAWWMKILLLFIEVGGFSVMKMHQLLGGFDGMSV